MENFTNNSGQGEGTIVPSEVKKFNWGAFCLTWIWGIFNKSWITFTIWGLAILCFILAMFTGTLIAKTIYNLGGLGLAIWFGIKGNEWAWQNKHWNSLKHFHDVQKKWAIGGIIAFLLLIVLLIIGILAALIIPTLYNNTSKVSEGYAIKKSLTMVMSAFSGIETGENCDLSSEGLASCMGARLSLPADGNRVMIGQSNDYLEFTGDGNCSNSDACYITIVTANGNDRIGLQLNEEGKVVTNRDDISMLINKIAK